MKELRRTLADTLTFLRSVPLFAGLDEAALNRLARAGRFSFAPKGFIIFSQTDPAEAAFIVRSGQINILLTTVDGRELVINEMRAGDCFGELSLVTNLPRSTEALVHIAAEIFTLPRHDFLTELENQPRMLRHLLETTAHRLQSSSDRESALAFLDASARLARVLLQLDREYSADGFITIGQDDLAQRLGLARQTVAKTLGLWRRSGWLVTGRGKIVVINRPALRRVAKEIGL
jgi:CRP/FNR family cyclic AMP-dependent transcriptional regulator